VCQNSPKKVSPIEVNLFEFAECIKDGFLLQSSDLFHFGKEFIVDVFM